MHPCRARCCRSWVFPLALAMAAAPAGVEPAGVQRGLSVAVDAIFAPAAGRALPGCFVAVVHGGTLVHSKAYGLANVETAEPNTSRTRYRLASVTKSFTALAVMQLVQQGRLGLDDPLDKHLPGFTGGDRILIRHLLSHTAGLPDFMSVEQAMAVPPDGAPGERLNYSNVGYAVLGRVIEKVTGRTYGAHLREAVFAPLGMKDTEVEGPSAATMGHAVGYLFTPGGGVARAEHTSLGRDAAAGGLSSTGDDMTAWMRALLANRIVKASTLEQMTTSVTLAGARRGAYGYGFMLVPYRGLREIGHGGDISGFNTYVALYPEERIAIAVLCNVGMRPPGPLPTAGEIAHRILGVLAGERLGPEWPRQADVPQSVLRRYAGRFRLVAPAPVAEVMGEALEIAVEGTRVVISGKQGTAEILPESETAFFSKTAPVHLTFVPGPDGSWDEGVLSLMGLRAFRLKRER